MGKKNKQQAFTLVELLVVISIISLLASIVLSSINAARIKANNAAINRQVMQYANALELYRSQNNSYPISATQYACLGIGYDSSWCYQCQSGADANCGTTGSYREGSTLSTDLKNALLSFIPSPRIGTKKFYAFTVGVDYNWQGAVYQYDAAVPASRLIIWMLQGTNQLCAKAQNFISVAVDNNYLTNGNTRCQATLQ